MPGYSDYAGAHVMVTGAAAGIGRACARAFATQGARVTAVDLDAKGLAETQAHAPDAIAVLTCDLSDPEDTEKMFNTAIAAQGPLRALVNNAGVDQRCAFDQDTADRWRWMMAVNLDHHALLGRLAAPGMSERGGAIVNMSSTAWMKLAGDLTAYHAAKAGVVGLTRGMARDLGGQGIRVNAIAPGRVVTERVAAAVDDAWAAETRSLQCLPELISPADIAETTLWLCSDAARMITGQTIVVDGGVV
ncbi:SDR family NAD(P)-dependent oxidoreductase [Actibacterium mucosum]|nr:SDR family oxidoreductase [Actibacterium mucosum]